MPRLNQRGQVVSGVSGPVSICDGPGQPVRVVAHGNHAVWLDDDRVLYGGANGSLWSVWVYDQRTGKQPTVLDPRTHDWLAAGGGVWGAVGPGGFFGSLPLDAGVRLSLTGTDSRGACGRDGTLAITDDTSGLGFTLIAPSGEATSGAPGFAAYGLSVVGPTQAIWPQGERLTTLNLPTPLHIGPSGEARWCVVNGRPWVVHYLADVGLVARPIDSDVGIVIETQPVFFHYDAMSFNGTIRVCYSTTAGEAPDQLVVRDLDLSRATKIIAGAPPPVPEPVPPPIPEPTPMPEIPNLFSLVQAVWTKHGGQHRAVMLNEIAWVANGGKADGPWGLSRKRGGEHVVQPITGEWVAHDIVQYGPTSSAGIATMFDVFTDTGPSWSQANQHNDPARIWLPAVAPAGVLVPGPVPGPVPPGSVSIDAAVEARIAAALKDELENAWLVIEQLTGRIIALEEAGSQPAPFPTRVALKSDHGRYLVAEGDHSVKADREHAGAWEIWTLEPKD